MTWAHRRIRGVSRNALYKSTFTYLLTYWDVIWGQRPWPSISRSKSAVYNTNRSGPSTDPCGTPHRIIAPNHKSSPGAAEECGGPTWDRLQINLTAPAQTGHQHRYLEKYLTALWARLSLTSDQSCIEAVNRGGCMNCEGGGRSLPFPSAPFPSPFPMSLFPLRFKLGSLKPASPGQKRICCTLQLSESHLWQSFWIFWVPWLTIHMCIVYCVICV